MTNETSFDLSPFHPLIPLWEHLYGNGSAPSFEDFPSLSESDYLLEPSTEVSQKLTGGVAKDINWVEVGWIILFGAMLSTSIFGNLILIWIIGAHRRMRSVTNFFVLFLGVSDLAMASFNGIPNFIYMLKNDWIFGKTLCIVNNFTANWTVASCVFTMTAIAVDRWIAIVRPLEPRMTKTTSWLTILGIWIGSCVLASPTLIYTNLITSSRGTVHCIVVWPDGLDPTNSIYEFVYNICLLVLTYLIPMTLMGICYIWMSIELWFTQVGEITQRQINSRIAKRKVVLQFFIISSSFFILWGPYHGYFVYMHYDKSVVYKRWIQHLYLSFFFMAMSQSAVNPLIVIGMNRRFRAYLHDLLLNCSLRRPASRQQPHFTPASPPLLRRYSQSCSHSRSKSRSGNGTGTGDGMGNGRAGHHHHHDRTKNNKGPHIRPQQEFIQLSNSMNPGVDTQRTTRATYC